LIRLHENLRKAITAIMDTAKSIFCLRRRRRRFCVAILLGAVVLAAATMLRPPSWFGDQDVSAHTLLEVPTTALELGQIWIQDETTVTLPMRNTTGSQVRVREFWTSCNCSSIRPKELTLAPHETCDLTVKMNVAPRDNRTAALATYPFSLTITAVLDETSTAALLSWTLKGIVRNPFVSVPAIVTFDEPLIRGTVFPGHELTVVSREPLRRIRAKAIDNLVRISERVAADGRFTIIIYPLESLQSGRFASRVLLEALDASESTFASTTLTMVGDVVGDLQITPSHLSFGALEIGSTVTETVVIRSRTDREFEIESITSSISGVSCQLASLDRLSARVVLECKPVDLGTHKGDVTISVKYDDGTRQSETVNVLYHGVAGV
jgi:hypothetical protein